MKMSEVFERSALWMERAYIQDGCCHAVWEFDGKPYLQEGRRDFNTPIQKYFQELFKPDGKPPAYWWNRDIEAKQARVLALCFAAAIAKSEGL